MKYIILGTGGVGGFFGSRLALAGNDVWFVSRGKHLEAMKRSGLRVRSTAGDLAIPPGKMTDRAADSGAADVVLFCVKSYDTEAAAKQLAPILNDSSIVLCLQNGIDNEEKIRRIITRGVVYGGVAYISARITAPGEITETGGFQKIALGPLDGPVDNRARDLRDVFVRAGIRCDLSDVILKDIWNKFVFIASMGSFTALSRLTQGEIIDSPQTLSLVFDAMREVQQIAWKLGVRLEPLDEAVITKGLKRFDSATRSSMYYDLVNEKPLEVEALNGTVVRLGQQVGVPTPIHRVIYTSLLPYHRKFLNSRSPQVPA
ncbi:MAG: ketopantoate reductase family protein [Ignavibacteria bacterium]|nr:ketopantoate reductase family protein [Ignavibacteria bacterium]